MIEWLLADHTAPNWFWLLVALYGGFALFTVVDSTGRLRRSTQRWNEVAEMHRMIIGHEPSTTPDRKEGQG